MKIQRFSPLLTKWLLVVLIEMVEIEEELSFFLFGEKESSVSFQPAESEMAVSHVLDMPNKLVPMQI